MNRIRSFVAALLLLFSTVVPQNYIYALGSGGLGNETGISAKTGGHGFAFAGVANDPSAIFYNPAGLTQVKGWQTELGATVLRLNSEHSSSSGQTDKMQNGAVEIPFLYVSHSGENSPWAFGVGVNSPYGLRTTWADDSFAKYYATESKLLLYMVNPTISYAVNHEFSIGAGIDYVNMFDVSLKRKVSSFGVEPDGDAELSGRGNGWGYNIGFHWKPVEKHSFGLSYRSQINIPVEGEAKLRNLQGAAAVLGAGGGSSFTTNLRTEFKLPQSILFGYGYHPIDRWTLFADYQWTNWKTAQETHVDYGQGNLLLPSTIPRDWRNTNSIGAGAELKANDRWDVRFGGLIYERVVPSRTLEASLPESSRWLLSCGTGYHIGNTRIDAALGAVFFNKRNINNDQEVAGLYSQDGTYKTVVPFFNLGVKQKWGGEK